ncbi:MAG: hypothetical protein JXR83_01320 [Deltaproteobacteria bacterium]|nr:hypothetical protein [Deltaproteobacteria bacterium]
MKCVMCGTKLRAIKGAPTYDLGLDRPIVLVGADAAQCPNCGEKYVGVPQVEELHRLVAQSVANKKARLTPREIRYLRTWLGYSGAEFAREVGVTKETVCRWERVDAPAPMGRAAELLLRLMVATRSPRHSYPLKEWGADEVEPATCRVKLADGKWCEAAA